MTWYAPSASGDTTGIVVKMHYGIDQATKRVSELDLGISDWDLGQRDESMAYNARLKAEREGELQAKEANKSDVVKF